MKISAIAIISLIDIALLAYVVSLKTQLTTAEVKAHLAQTFAEHTVARLDSLTNQTTQLAIIQAHKKEQAAVELAVLEQQEAILEQRLHSLTTNEVLKLSHTH